MEYLKLTSIDTSPKSATFHLLEVLLQILQRIEQSIVKLKTAQIKSLVVQLLLVFQ